MSETVKPTLSLFSYSKLKKNNLICFKAIQRVFAEKLKETNGMRFGQTSSGLFLLGFSNSHVLIKILQDTSIKSNLYVTKTYVDILSMKLHKKFGPIVPLAAGIITCEKKVFQLLFIR